MAQHRERVTGSALYTEPIDRTSHDNPRRDTHTQGTPSRQTPNLKISSFNDTATTDNYPLSQPQTPPVRNHWPRNPSLEMPSLERPSVEKPSLETKRLEKPSLERPSL